jgi:hypothetical protein
MSKCQNSERGLKRLVGAAYYHQTEVRERTPDKKKDHDEQRQQDDRSEAESHPSHRRKTVVLIRKQAERLQTEGE